MKNLLELMVERGVEVPHKNRERREVMVRCPFHDDKTPSMSVNTEKNVYYCHGCGAKGDAVTFVKEFDRCSIKEALKAVGKEKSYSKTMHPLKRTPASKAKVIVPVPKDAPSYLSIFPKAGNQVDYEYYDTLGDLAFIVRRQDSGTGKKVFTPISYTSDGWKKTRPENMPLYGVYEALMEPKKPVMIVEGEKTAEAAKRLFGDFYAVVTWHGGANAVDSSNWTPLTKRKVVICPDNDAPGREAAEKIKSIVEGLGCEVKIWRPNGIEIPRGWDWADFGGLPAEAKTVLDNGLLENDLEPNAPDYELVMPFYRGLFSSDEPMKGAGCATRSAKNYLLECKACGHEIINLDGVLSLWTGKRWRMIDKDELKLVGDSVICVDWAEAQSSPANLEGFADMVALFADKVQAGKTNTVKINFLNGTLHICIDSNKKQFKPHAKNDFLNYVLPYDYDPTAEAVEYQKALDEWLPSKDEQRRLHQTVAYALLNGTDVKTEKVLYLYGFGGTGKSTLLDHFANVFGESNVSHVSLKALVAGPTGCYSAVGKLINIDEEAPASMPDASRFKALVSKSNLEFRELYKNPITTNRVPMLWFASNFRINFNDVSGAIERRLEIFEFKNKPSVVDRRLKSKLSKELSGTINLVIKALQELIAGNFEIVQTADSITQLQERRESTDIIGEFLTDIGATKIPSGADKSYWVKSEALSAAFAEWCKAHGKRVPAPQHYSQGLKAHGFEKDRAYFTGSGGGKKYTYWTMVATNIERYLKDKMWGLAVDYKGEFSDSDEDIPVPF